MVWAVQGRGRGPVGRVPLGVAAAGVAVVADLLPDGQPVGRVPELRISLKPSDVTGVTVARQLKTGRICPAWAAAHAWC